MAPNRPHRYLKYSHLGRAKPTRVPNGPLSPLLTIGVRCLSPMNIVLTHTPGGGNYSINHIHEIDGHIHNDLAEEKAGEIVLPFAIALMARHVKGVSHGTACLMRFLELADILGELNMNSAILQDETKFNNEMDLLWNQSANRQVKISSFP